jgi:hypothetical protein
MIARDPDPMRRVARRLAELRERDEAAGNMRAPGDPVHVHRPPPRPAPVREGDA